MSFKNSNKNLEPKRKRKITEEKRIFNEKWTDDYFFVEVNSKAMCLICNEFNYVNKDYNLKRHYTQKHFNEYNVYQRILRKEKIADLKKVHHPSNLSRQTIARIIEELGKSVLFELTTRAANFKLYSFAIDISTDASDTAQFAIFFRGIDEEYNLTEEMASLVPLKNTKKSIDLYTAIKNTLNRFSLSVKNISGIATDGASEIVGRKEGVAKLLDAVSSNNLLFIKYHCIVQQENLCAKCLQMNNVMAIVIETINFIREKGLNYRQFQKFLKIIDAEYDDIIYFSEVRWLSRGNMLKRLYDLKNEIKLFMESKEKYVTQFENE